MIVDIKGIYDQVKLGGFRNPLEAPMNNVKLKFEEARTAISALAPPVSPALTDLRAQLTVLKANKPETTMEKANNNAAIAAVNAQIALLPLPTDKYSKAVDSFTAAIENAETMASHSRILSGVDPAAVGVLTTIAKVGNAASAVEKLDGCSLSSSVLGSLQNAATIINKTTTAIQKVDELIGDVETFIDDIPDLIDSYAYELQNQVIADIEAYAEAKLIVANNATAAALVDLTENKCFATIMSSVMTTSLKTEVTKVTDELKAIKFNSIGG